MVKVTTERVQNISDEFLDDLETELFEGVEPPHNDTQHNDTQHVEFICKT